MPDHTDFSNTLATIAAKAMTRRDMTPERAVEFAWFSVATPGDASIDDEDFVRHLREFRAAGL